MRVHIMHTRMCMGACVQAHMCVCTPDVCMRVCTYMCMCTALLTRGVAIPWGTFTDGYAGQHSCSVSGKNQIKMEKALSSDTSCEAPPRP